MKRMIWILALAILPGLLSAQTTVATVTITVPTAAVPIVTPGSQRNVPSMQPMA